MEIFKKKEYINYLINFKNSNNKNQLMFYYSIQKQKDLRKKLRIKKMRRKKK